MTKLASLPATPRTSARTPSYPRTVCVALVALGCGGISAPNEAPATGGSANVAGGGNLAGFGPSLYETGGAANPETGGTPSLAGDVATVFSTGGDPGTGGAPSTGGASAIQPATGGAANFAGGVAEPFEIGGTSSASSTGS